MRITECIFEGYIVECDCGKTMHTTFDRLPFARCPCGRHLGGQRQPANDNRPAYLRFAARPKRRIRGALASISNWVEAW